MTEMTQKLPKSTRYSLQIFHTVSVWLDLDDEPFRFKQLEKMVKDFMELTSTSLWRIAVFHNMSQGYSLAQVFRSRCHGVENLAW